MLIHIGEKANASSSLIYNSIALTLGHLRLF